MHIAALFVEASAITRCAGAWLRRAFAMRTFAARRVVAVMRTAFRHRNVFTTDVADDFNRLLHHFFDSFNFRLF